jgi:MFS family permease
VEGGPGLTRRWPNTPFYYGWVIVAVVFLAEFTTSGMGGSTISLFFKPMTDSLGWSLTSLVGAVTAQAVAGMVIAPLLGPLLDRYGARPVMLFGALAAGAGLLIMMAVQEVWQFWILYAAVGALGLNELGRLSGPVVVTKWFIRRRGRAMAIAISGAGIGAMVMAPITALLIASIGWRYSWGVMGITLMVLMVPAVLLFMRRQPEDMGLLPDGATPQALAPADGPAASPLPQAELEPSWSLREALRTRTMWILVVSLNLVNLATVPMVLLQVPYFTEQGMSNQGASYLFTLSWLGFTISRFIWGFVAEHVPIRFALAGMCLARSLGIFCLVLVPYPYNIGPFLLFSGVLGGAMGILQPMAFANYYGRASTGRIQGAIRPLMSVPQLVGPLTVAILFDATGSFSFAFMGASVLGFLGTAIVLFAKPPVRRVRAA